MSTEKHNPEAKYPNRDPLTLEPGAHPVGTGVGAAVGGSAAGAALGAAGAAASVAIASATVGMAAGPVGAVVGAVAGGIVGGLVGKQVAESVHPTAENAYGRDTHHTGPSLEKEMAYEDYLPAYEYGRECRARCPDRPFSEMEAELERGWEKTRPDSKLGWDKAKLAVRDAWERMERKPEPPPLPRG
jgi:hypothetical protein